MPIERFYRTTGSVGRCEVTGSAGIQVFHREDSPVGTPAASRARRLDFGSSSRTVEIELDADRQVRRVFDVSGAVPAERRRLRWAPGGRGRVVESRSWNDSAQLTADVQFLQDLGLLPRGLSQIGGGICGRATLRWWLRPTTATGAVPCRVGASPSATRSGPLWEVRAQADRDGPGDWRSGDALGTAASGRGTWATQMADEDVPTAEQARIRAGLPDPSFLDDEWGFPGAASPVQKTDATYDPGMRCWRGTNLARNGCPAGLSLTQVSETPDITPCYATEPDCRGGGRAESGEGSGPGFSHPQEPIRNADTHPLGVTLSNGNFMLTVSDLALRGHGLDLTLTRTFRSQSFEQGALGNGWSLS